MVKPEKEIRSSCAECDLPLLCSAQKGLSDPETLPWRISDPNKAAETVSVRQLWQACRSRLRDAEIENAAQEADWLWQAVCGQDRHLMAPQETLPEAVAQKLWVLVCKRASHMPLQYLLGRWPFLDFELDVGPGVLIPRADTECVAECAVRLAQEIRPAGLLLDLCAGSGVLALALATRLNQRVTAVELSAEALPYLSNNTKRVCAQFGVPPVAVVQADVLQFQQTLAPASVGLIVSNPPYLTAQEMTQLQPEVAFEPSMALKGGEDGLLFYRHLARAYREKLVPGGALVLEIGAAQGNSVCSLLEENGWHSIALVQDTAGLDRCVSARR